MGLRAFQDELLADIHAGLDGVGADTAEYRAPGADSFVPARVFMRYDSEVLGEFGQITGYRTEADFLTADVDPKVKGALRVEGADYVLTDKLYERNGIASWVVRRG
jgi:hypothetical protein